MQPAIYFALNLPAAEVMTPTAVEPLTAVESSHDVIDRTAHLFISLIALLTLWICLYALFYQWLRYRSPLLSVPPPPGLKKASLKLLPTTIYPSRFGDTKQTDCVICLTEFADGDLTKTLPLCGHVFHMDCVDEWLRSCSSCPSCRRLVVVDGFSSDQNV